jgi:hypothetical protein
MKQILAFIFLLLLFSCKKSNDSKSNSFYFKGKVNGKDIKWVSPILEPSSNQHPQFKAGAVTQAGNGGALGGLCNTGDLNYQLHEGTNINEDHPGSPLNFSNSVSVIFVRSEKPPFAPYSEMRSWFTNGTKTFGILRLICSDPILDGIVITYSDENNKSWVSSFGNQSSNTFEQISLVEGTTNALAYTKKWTVRFSGKLYDGTGAFIELKDCELYGPVFPL